MGLSSSPGTFKDSQENHDMTEKANQYFIDDRL